ncbi:uncharacterized protein GGS22DRAFT_191177 [Annulohypoxylon maeteangense]|uniref:uncharacterized protein n=1 Tax=Annulohypoxylon maeteangense TaxID=1927788 RepID=UPI0020088CA1|nr:uncharacterized protein GGS22DRAFT_191177 [Annulohypoxylon maeteangense]KAI0882586.1 hypothetical protein GGS22DRAFT_191177 [Annulohypoxylon maeteangense]
MAGVYFKRPSWIVDFSSKVRHDPFGKLPFTAICKILHQLPAECLLDVLKASWTLHSLVHGRHSFWKNALEKNMPWFPEVPELMRIGALRREEHYKGIYLWAERNIWPRKGVPKILMNIANRRRIWTVSEVIADIYLGRFGQRIISWGDEEEEEEEEL